MFYYKKHYIDKYDFRHSIKNIMYIYNNWDINLKWLISRHSYFKNSFLIYFQNYSITSVGGVTLKTQLDYESSQTDYTVIIEAIDQGKPSLTG